MTESQVIAILDKTRQRTASTSCLQISTYFDGTIKNPQWMG